MDLFDAFRENNDLDRSQMDERALAYDLVVKSNIAYLFFSLCKNKI